MTTINEPVPSVKQQVMSDERDFSRPRPSFFINQLDSNNADSIYSDLSEQSDNEEDSIYSLETTPQNKETKQQDSSIKIFQSFLSTSLPIIGKVYNGPIDGIYNDQLGEAAKAIESAVSKATGSSAAGLVFSNSTKTFNTTPSDILSALKLLSKKPKTEKAAAIRKRISLLKKIIS